MTIDEMIAVVADCKFPDYTFKVWEDSRGAIYMQGSYEEPDTVTNVWSIQKTRRWLMSPKMTKSEIVATCFKCLMTSQEHKAREWFKYKGKSIYGPHYDVDDLLRICDHMDTREDRMDTPVTSSAEIMEALRKP